jgi:hypothetical protein
MKRVQPSAPAHPKLKRLSRVLVVGFWIVMMATLVRQWILEVRPEFVPGTYRSVLTREREDHHWRMGVYLPLEGGLTRVGHTETLYTPLRDSGQYKIQNSTQVSIPLPGALAGVPARFELETTAWISGRYELQQVLMHLRSDAFEADCRGTVNAGKLTLHPRVDGQPMDPYVVELPSGKEVVSQGLSRLMSLPPLSEGMRWEAIVVNPITMQPSVVEMTVLRREKLQWGGKLVDTHRLEVRSGPVRSHAWVSLSGEVLKEKTLFGLTLIKEAVPEPEE